MTKPPWRSIGEALTYLLVVWDLADRTLDAIADHEARGIPYVDADARKRVRSQPTREAAMPSYPTPFSRAFLSGISPDMAVDASGAEQRFKLVPAAGEVLIVQRLALVVAPVPTDPVADYSGATALGTGIAIEMRRNDVLVARLHPGTTIQVFNALLLAPFHAEASSAAGGYATANLAPMTAKANNGLEVAGIALDAGLIDTLEIALNDDHSGMTLHFLGASGLVLP